MGPLPPSSPFSHMPLLRNLFSPPVVVEQRLPKRWHNDLIRRMKNYHTMLELCATQTPLRPSLSPIQLSVQRFLRANPNRQVSPTLFPRLIWITHSPSLRPFFISVYDRRWDPSPSLLLLSCRASSPSPVYGAVFQLWRLNVSFFDPSAPE